MPNPTRTRRRGAGVTLDCLEAGPPDGPLIILLHGFPEDALSWSRQVAALAAAGLRVLAPDQRGYGASDQPQGRAAYGLDRLADDVAALAADVGRDRFDLVGHDWGGAVAWWTAAREPQRVRRLAILNAPHPATMAAYARRAPIQFLRSGYMGLFQLPAIPELALGAAHGWLLAQVMVNTSRPGAFAAADLARLRQAWRRPGAMTAMLNWYRALPLQPRDTGRSQRIACPTLILWGARDAFLERGLAMAAAELCDAAEVVYLEHAGHWIQHEQPEEVEQSLLRFLKP